MSKNEENQKNCVDGQKLVGKNRLAACHSSNTDEWSTPQAMFDRINQEFGPFDVDVCANSGNAKCPRFYTLEDDGLSKRWSPMRVWCNPPYSDLKAWMKKAYEESLQGAYVVALIPARTDTKAFHEFIAKGKIIFIKGRLKFGNAKSSAPFPSMLVIFDGHTTDRTWGTLEIPKTQTLLKAA